MEREIVITLVIKGNENLVESTKRDVIQVASEILQSLTINEISELAPKIHEKKCCEIKVPCCFKQIFDDGK